MNKYAKLADRIFCGAFVVTGALTLGSFPAYVSEYTKNLEGYYERAKNNSLDEDAKVLEEKLIRIKRADGLEKLQVFLIEKDKYIAKKTFDEYSPKINPTNLDGFQHTTTGATAGLLTYSLITAIGSLFMKKKDPTITKLTRG